MHAESTIFMLCPFPSRPSSVDRGAAPPRRFCVPAGTRVYAIGDVHGRADLLAERFRAIDRHLAGNPVPQALEITLGDYVDRGLDSAGVIELLLARRRHRQLVTLAGNHEEIPLRCLDDHTKLEEWLRLGGAATLLSYGVAPPKRIDEQAAARCVEELRGNLPSEHLEFLRTLGLIHHCGELAFVHAGIDPAKPIEHQTSRDVLWIREAFLRHEGDFGVRVVHGHTPAPAIDIRFNRINVDTGAYATGNLSCAVLERDGVEALP